MIIHTKHIFGIAADIWRWVSLNTKSLTIYVCFPISKHFLHQFQSNIKSIISFSTLSNTGAACLYVHLKTLFLKSMFELVCTYCYCLETTSKLHAHSTCLKNMVIINRRESQTPAYVKQRLLSQLKKMKQDYSNIWRNKKSTKVYKKEHLRVSERQKNS